MVVEDGAEHLSVFSRFLSAPLGKKMAAFPQNYCRPRKKTLRAEVEGSRILLRIESKDRGWVVVIVYTRVTTGVTLKDVLKLADANATLRCIV